MLSEINPSNIAPALIKDEGEALLNKNCTKKGAKKNPMVGTVRGIKPLRLQSPVLYRGGKLTKMALMKL